MEEKNSREESISSPENTFSTTLPDDYIGSLEEKRDEEYMQLRKDHGYKFIEEDLE